MELSGRVTVGALLLAAGSARRMGASKLSLPVDGVAVARRTADAIAAAGLPCVAVLGGHADAVRAVLPESMRVIVAADHATGQSASLRAGIAALPADWDAALVCLADMPWVRAETYAALAAELARGWQAVAPWRGGARGNPAGFARALWPALLKLSGDRGAGALLAAMPVADGGEPVMATLRRVVVDDDGVLRDIDVLADLGRWV